MVATGGLTRCVRATGRLSSAVHSAAPLSTLAVHTVRRLAPALSTPRASRGVSTTSSRRATSAAAAPRPFAAIPGPPHFPLVQNLPHFLPGGRYFNVPLLRLLDVWRAEFGPMWKVEQPGRTPTVFLTNPDDVALVFKADGKMPIRDEFHAYAHYRTARNMGYGIAAAEGEQWKAYRELGQRVLGGPQEAMKYVGKNAEAADMFIEHLQRVRTGVDETSQPASPPNTVRNFQEEAKVWSFESMNMMALGRPLGLYDSNTDATRLFEATTDLFECFTLLAQTPPFWRLVKTPLYRRMGRAADTVLDTCRTYVRDALQAPIAGSMLASVAGEIRTDEQLEMVTDVFSDLLFSAIDTTSTTLTYLVHCLAQNPACQEKARREVLSLLPDPTSEITPRVVNKLSYLKACLKEALRMHHVAVGVGRVLTTPLVLSGYEVPAGVKCSVMSSMMSLDPANFADPQSFVPERWIRSEPQYTKPSQWAYLPFGHGSRSCIGRRFAELETWVAAAQVLRRFRIATTTPEIDKAMKLITIPAQPVNVQLSDL